MRKSVLLLITAGLFLIFVLGIVSAVPKVVKNDATKNATDVKDAKIDAIKNITEAKAVKNMTYGQCTANATKVRNGCYKEVKKVLSTCNMDAKNQTDKKAVKTAKKECNNDYKKGINQCKEDFKSAKADCVKFKVVRKKS